MRGAAMKSYSHLSFWERERIAFLRADGLCVSDIATALGRHPGTIYRELARNANLDGSYRPVSAEARYLSRRQRERIIDACPALAGFIRERLCEGWTPEQISGWLATGNEKLPHVCFETIYAWIFTGVAKADKLWKLLPGKKATRRRKRSSTRTTIADGHSIHDRPQEVETRQSAGHWECDLMICKRTRPVLVLKERKSRFTIAAKLAGKTAAETAGAIMEIFQRLDPGLRKSITFDRGPEFAKHSLIAEAMHLSTWFCDAYASWQKGAVENFNGRLRRDLPRKTDIDAVSDEDLQDIMLTHNLTPRKCLGFKTPMQALLQELGIDVKISFSPNLALRD